MSEAKSEEALRFNRRFRFAIIIFAVVEFVVIACVVSYVVMKRNL